MTDPIFVIGSKPQAEFPVCTPKRVYAANGAIARAQPFLSEYDVPLTGLLWRRFLVADDRSRQSPTAKALVGCRGKRLIISGEGPRKARFESPSARGLSFEMEESLSRLSSLRLKLQYASLTRVVGDINRDVRQSSVAKVYSEIKRKRSHESLGISTGMLAVLMALREAKAGARVYVIGIGIDEQEGQYYDSSGGGRYRHVAADKAMVRDLVCKVPADTLVFTDPKFAAFAADCRKQS